MSIKERIGHRGKAIPNSYVVIASSARQYNTGLHLVTVNCKLSKLMGSVAVYTWTSRVLILQVGQGPCTYRLPLTRLAGF